MPTLTISLPEKMKEFIESEVTLGSYGTVSEYLRALVRDAQNQRTNAKLDELLLEGLQSEVKDMTAQDWEEMRQEIKARHSRRRSA